MEKHVAEGCANDMGGDPLLVWTTEMTGDMREDQQAF